jgi:hypothetical protein
MKTRKIEKWTDEYRGLVKARQSVQQAIDKLGSELSDLFPAPIGAVLPFPEGSPYRGFVQVIGARYVALPKGRMGWRVNGQVMKTRDSIPERGVSVHFTIQQLEDLGYRVP